MKEVINPNSTTKKRDMVLERKIARAVGEVHEQNCRCHKSGRPIGCVKRGVEIRLAVHNLINRLLKKSL